MKNQETSLGKVNSINPDVREKAAQQPIEEEDGPRHTNNHPEPVIEDGEASTNDFSDPSDDSSDTTDFDIQ